MLKVICAGLPRTGNTSLAEALRILGYKTLQHATERLPLFPTADTSFQVFDDVDAVVDLPAAMYWRELLEAYPEAKVILTVRDVDDWYQSMVRHIEVMRAAGDTECDRLHTLVFGSAEPSEHWYKRRFQEHNAALVGLVDDGLEIHGDMAFRKATSWEIGTGLLLLSVTDGRVTSDPWQRLCDFLDKPIPDVPFPWLNKGETNDE